MPTLQDALDLLEEMRVKPSEIKMDKNGLKDLIREITETKFNQNQKHVWKRPRKAASPKSEPDSEKAGAEPPGQSPIKRFLGGLGGAKS
jgi:hypothetical protein